MKVFGHGPQPARIMIIGEAPGAEEEKQGRPFVGGSGQELSRMMNDAGLLRTEARVTNVCKFRPPGNKLDLWWASTKKQRLAGSFHELDGEWFDIRVLEGIQELRIEIEATQPNVIVPMGNLALWATTRKTGITKWRSSLLHLHESYEGIQGYETIKVIPTIHPAAVLRSWDWRYLVVHDLRRVKGWHEIEGFPEPNRNYIVRPNIAQVLDTLNGLLLRVQSGEQVRLAVDVETRARHIACVGIAWSRADALCIPFQCVERPEGYWSAEDELRVVLLLRELLTHPKAFCIGQNWQYDYQYFARDFFFEVNLQLDIMSEHHVQQAGLPKGLDFQSSLYRPYHVYWKDEGKEWDPKVHDEDSYWVYNCDDCTATYEIAEVLEANRSLYDLRRTSYGSPHEIQQRLTLPMARASYRGVCVDHDRRRKMAFLLFNDIQQTQDYLEFILQAPGFNVDSPLQMHRLFYEEFGVKKILHRKTRKPTLDADALEKIGKIHPMLRFVTSTILHLRRLHKSQQICLKQLSPWDGRFRSQYTIPGTETYRFASSTDPFGYGDNGQNLSSGQEEDMDWRLPNLRRFLIPAKGHLLQEYDLPQADARVVAWEAEDEELIAMFEDPSRHLHMENAEIIFGKRPASKADKNYYFAKQGVHLTNYGGTPQVLAMTLGITVHEAEHFQSRWFGAHPKIRDWHHRVQVQLARKRYVENKFGYRRFYYDRMEGLLKEALAWIPQSTVAICTNLAILACDGDDLLRSYQDQLLMQVHDSHVRQCPTHYAPVVIPRVIELSTITVPYAYPLVLRPEAKVSDVSWGDCVAVK